jgi:hypothetical protein
LQSFTQLQACARLPLEQRPARSYNLVDVHSIHGLPERDRVERSLENRPHDRPQRKAVSRSDEVNRGAHEPDAHRLTVPDQIAELVRLKAVEARPEAEVRVDRLLRLHSDESFEDLGDGQFPATEEHLPLKQSAVELTRGKELCCIKISLAIRPRS